MSGLEGLEYLALSSGQIEETKGRKMNGKHVQWAVREGEKMKKSRDGEGEGWRRGGKP